MMKTTVYLPEELRLGIHRIAEQRGMSAAAFIRASLWAAIAETKPDWDTMPVISSPELAAIENEEAFLRDNRFGT